MSESFEQRMKIFRENLAGMYDNGHMTKWADVDTSVDLDCLQAAHDYELGQTCKTEYHRGYEDGRRSMDAEHYAVALRLRALPLDGDTTENLAQIARAIWHSDFGWTEGACKALRDELVRLMGGVSERPYTTSTYDVLGNERHKVVCKLREIRDCLKNDSTCNSLNIADAIGAKLDVGDHLHESICDRLIHLLGGDEPAESLGSYLSRKSVEAMSGRADQSHEPSPMRQENETGITAELRECIETANKSHDRCISEAELLEIADRIDEQFARACELWERTATDTAQSVHDDMEAECNKLQAECDRLTAALDELHADPANDAICRLERERDELRAKLDEAEFAIANWREREKSFDASERMRKELRERLEETEEALSKTAGKLAMAETRLRDARAKLDVLEENGLTLMHRTLKNMLGEAKSTHDVLRAKVEAMPSFDRERRRLMRVADESERRCSELLDLLRDAAKDFKALMEKDTYANGRKA